MEYEKNFHLLNQKKIFEVFLRFVLSTLIWLLNIIDIKLYSQPIQPHVVLVIIDGARYTETLGDPLYRYIPEMKQLAAQGAVVDTFLNDYLTYTKRAIPAIWCGSWATPKDTTINGYLTQYTSAPTVWEYYRKYHNQDSISAMYILKQLTGPWLPSYHKEYGPAYWPWYIMQDWSDLYVWQNAKTKLQKYHPILTLLYLADVDQAGHSGNWQQYTRAITISDSIVGMMWDFLQSDTVYKNKTTLIVTNDHGRHLDGISDGFVGHGDGCFGCRRIELLAVGSGVNQGHINLHRHITDITPTIGALLNFPTYYSTGNIMSEILQPIMSKGPDSIDFKNVFLSENKRDSFSIFNSGGVALPISIQSNEPFFTNVSRSIIPPHSKQIFYVAFTPDEEKFFCDFIFITNDSTDQKDSIKVRGSGIKRITISVDFRKGWNMLSLPTAVDDSRIASLYPNAVSQAFFYHDKYIPSDTIAGKQGYWIKFDTAFIGSISGMKILSDTFDVNEGWNLIGSISTSVICDSVETIPTANIFSPFFTFDGSYFPVDTIHAGKAYWIKMKSAGKLILRKR